MSDNIKFSNQIYHKAHMALFDLMTTWSPLDTHRMVPYSLDAGWPQFVFLSFDIELSIIHLLSWLAVYWLRLGLKHGLG